MNANEKIAQLKAEIDRQLKPLITSDFVYLDLPYHPNIGDTLIWKGTVSFIKALPHKCLLSTDYANFTFPEVSEKCVILMHGGGNFGDLYLKLNNFRKAVIARYPRNKVIVLSQTVYYEKAENLRADAEFYSGRDNVTICTRDTESYKLIETNFRGPAVRLVPDMAFYISPAVYARKAGRSGTRTLYLSRRDKEAAGCARPRCVPAGAEEHDWPTFERTPFIYWLTLKGVGLLRRLPGANALRRRYTDLVWQRLLLPYNVSTGISFLSRYHTVYTTRLHTAILSILLRRRSVVLLDNNYGKLKSFYETWLHDLDGAKYVREDEQDTTSL